MIVGAITVIALYLSGGSAGHVSVLEMLDQMSSAIEVHVEDPRRIEAAEDVLARSRADIEGSISELGEYRQELLATGASSGPDQVQMTAIFARVNQIRRDAERSFIRGQIELREHVTAEEWAAMYEDLKSKRK